MFAIFSYTRYLFVCYLLKGECRHLDLLSVWGPGYQDLLLSLEFHVSSGSHHLADTQFINTFSSSVAHDVTVRKLFSEPQFCLPCFDFVYSALRGNKSLLPGVFCIVFYNFIVPGLTLWSFQSCVL